MYEYTHIIAEAKSKFSPNLKPYTFTHDIIDTIEAFHQVSFNYLTIPPVKIKMKPVLFILKRKSNFKDMLKMRNFYEDANQKVSDSEEYRNNDNSSEKEVIDTEINAYSDEITINDTALEKELPETIELSEEETNFISDKLEEDSFHRETSLNNNFKARKDESKKIESDRESISKQLKKTKKEIDFNQVRSKIDDFKISKKKKTFRNIEIGDVEYEENLGIKKIDHTDKIIVDEIRDQDEISGIEIEKNLVYKTEYIDERFNRLNSDIEELSLNKRRKPLQNQEIEENTKKEKINPIDKKEEKNGILDQDKEEISSREFKENKNLENEDLKQSSIGNGFSDNEKSRKKYFEEEHKDHEEKLEEKTILNDVSNEVIAEKEIQVVEKNQPTIQKVLSENKVNFSLMKNNIAFRSRLKNKATPIETEKFNDNKQQVKRNLKKLIQKYRRKKFDDESIPGKQISEIKEEINEVVEDENKIQRDEVRKIQVQIMEIIENNPNIANKDLIKEKLQRTIIDELIKVIDEKVVEKTGKAISAKNIIKTKRLIEVIENTKSDSFKDLDENTKDIKDENVKYSNNEILREKNTGTIQTKADKIKEAQEKIEDIMNIIDDIVDTIEIHSNE